MVNTVMDKTTHAQLVVTAQAVGIDNAVRHNFPFYYRHQCFRLGIIHHNSVDPSLPFQDAEYHYLACRTTSSPAFAASAEIAFVQFDRAGENFIGRQCQMMADDLADFVVEQDSRVGLYAQNISSGTGGNFEYKNSSSFFCIFPLSLQLVICIFVA